MICEVCGSHNVTPALNLGDHPLCDDLVPVGDSRACTEYPIDIWVCPDCITAHQRCRVPKRELFPTDYHYRSRFTADVLNGMKNLVDACESHLGDLSGKQVLDIGCNDGSLLGFFRERGCVTTGVEPTNAADFAADSGHRVYKDYFAPDLAAIIKKDVGSIDIITFTNVFAHIEDLPSVLKALSMLISPQTLLVIENHYFGAVLDRFQFDTFYHEHPRTYSLRSFLTIAASLGLTLVSAQFPARYGGNIRVFMGAGSAASRGEIDAILEKELSFPERLKQMGPHVERWKKLARARLDALVGQHGPLTAKAFPGRSAILIKLLDIGVETISAVYEKPGSMKIDHYVPGTRIPICSDDVLFGQQQKPPVILNLAWHIEVEITKYLRANGFTMPIVNIVDVHDFTV